MKNEVNNQDGLESNPRPTTRSGRKKNAFGNEFSALEGRSGQKSFGKPINRPKLPQFYRQLFGRHAFQSL